MKDQREQEKCSCLLRVDFIKKMSSRLMDLRRKLVNIFFSTERSFNRCKKRLQKKKKK